MKHATISRRLIDGCCRHGACLCPDFRPCGKL